MHFETVIGLEVHVELKTDSKMFSPSPAHFGAEPNSNTNVIDLAYPGVLSLINLLEKMAILILKLMEKQNVSVLHVFIWKKMQVNQHIKMVIL